MKAPIRCELSVIRYRSVEPYTDRVETICAVSGESDGDLNAAIRSAVADLLALHPDAAGCIKAALQEADNKATLLRPGPRPGPRPTSDRPWA